MASRKPRLNVALSNKATRQLNEIYEYNLEKRGETTADRYIMFLRAKIGSLELDYDAGKTIECRPDLRYLLMIKRSGGDGHIAVYNVDAHAGTVEVRFIFHTKQDWENKL